MKNPRLTLGAVALAGLIVPVAGALPAPAAPVGGGQPVLVADIDPGAGSSIPSALTPVLGNLYFAAFDGGSFAKLWAYDPVGGLRTLHPGHIIDMEAGAGRLFFAVGAELWCTDGSLPGTKPLKTFLGPVTSMEPLGLQMGLAVNDGVSGHELWRSDGTPGGTVLVRDVQPGPGSSSPQDLAPAWGDLYFTADDGVHGREPWVSDGTLVGTHLVADIFPGPSASTSGFFFPYQGLVLFAADNGVHGRELWRSDGTASGTWMVADINAGSQDSDPSGFHEMNGIAYFTAWHPALGRELWRTDGTAAGTTIVKDVFPGPSSSTYAGPLGDLAGRLLLSAEDGTSGAELWISDGTAAGTQLLADIQPGAGSSVPDYGLVAGGKLYFRADDGATGRELWESDGTAAGTARVADLNPGPGWGMAGFPAVLGSDLYFSGDDGVLGQELWSYEVCGLVPVDRYCTAGTTASGCQALAFTAGIPSRSQASGFTVDVKSVEGGASGILFFGTNGRQANPWGNGTSYQCVRPPVRRTGWQNGTGSSGTCGGTFQLDFNAWMTANPLKAPSGGQLVQMQAWFRDPLNTSNQTTSLSSAVEFLVCP